MSTKLRRAGVIAATTFGLLLSAAVLAPPRPDARSVRGTTRTSVNRNLNVNYSVVAVHRAIDVDVDRDYHPVAAAGAVAAGAAAVGSVVQRLPPTCRTVVVTSLAYQHCDKAWYRPQYAGSQITYVVVNPPE